jgi:hypothetical protein
MPNTALILAGYTGDAAGPTVDRQPNEILLTAYHAESGTGAVGLFTPLGSAGSGNRVVIEPLTPGATGIAVITAIKPAVVNSGSYRISFGQQAGDPPWKNGVHVFSVFVEAQPGGVVSTGVTLATAIVRDPPQIGP